MGRADETENEDCHSCPEDCGQCFEDMVCNEYPPEWNNSSPEDPFLSAQWHLEASHVISSWKNYKIYGKGVKVAIVDDGLQWQHEDLQCNYDPELSFDVDRGEKIVYSWGTDNHGTSSNTC